MVVVAEKVAVLATVELVVLAEAEVVDMVVVLEGVGVVVLEEDLVTEVEAVKAVELVGMARE